MLQSMQAYHLLSVKGASISLRDIKKLGYYIIGNSLS